MIRSGQVLEKQIRKDIIIQLKIKQKRIGPVAGHHPWVFSRAFVSIPEGLSPGKPIKLVSENGAFLATGYFSSYSQITVRIWGYDENEVVDEQFFVRRIENAYGLRKRYVESLETNAYRLINSENDFLPGLIVDKYADYLVVQFHTRGIETWKDLILRALDLARENVKLNGFSMDTCEFIARDVKDYLKRPDEDIDVIILDPPAFIKDRRKKNEGIAGYKSINEIALRALSQNGILVTCSCSAHLTLEDFRFLLSEVGAKVRRPLRFIETYTHGIDHMQLVPFTEGEYLKCFFVSI